jgi:hypothetical protein
MNSATIAKTPWRYLFVGAMVLLSGCVKRPLPINGTSCDYRFIRAAVKIAAPEKIMTAVVSVTIGSGNCIRIDAADMFGVTQAVIVMSAGRIEWYSMSDRCRAVKNAWVSKLSYACETSLQYNRLTGWLFPESWPKTPVTYRIAPRGRRQCDITQYPPVEDDYGRVVVHIPGHDLKISINWIAEEENTVLMPELEIPGSWRDCTEFPLVDAMIRGS